MTVNRTTTDNQRLWVGLDQIASSALSFGCSALAAGLLTARDFGTWAVAFTIGVIILTAVRTWSGDGLMIVSPAHPGNSAVDAKGASTFGVCTGVACGLLLLVAAGLLKGSARAALAALAFGLPLVLAQDACRFSLLSQRRARAAFVNDSLWLVLSCAMLLTLRRLNNDSVFLSMASWSVLALPSVAVGFVQTRAGLSLSAALRWVRSIQYLSSRLLAEYVVFMASSLLALTVVIGVFGDIELAGSLRGALVLMGPITVVLAASTIYLQPRMVVDHTVGHTVVGRGRDQSASVVGITAIWVVLLHLVPDSFGTRVFGFTWFGARTQLFEVGLMFCFAGASVGAINVLRCTGRVAMSLRAHLILACVVAIGTSAGAIVDGSFGAVTGFTFSSAAGPVLLWRSALRHHPTMTKRVERSLAFRRSRHAAEHPSA